jgi:hypothetical protein
MPLPFDPLSLLRNKRKSNRREKQQDKAELSAILGNEAGLIYVPGFNGNKVYVRLLGDTENGNATYQPSSTAYIRGDFFEYSGSPVLVKYNRNRDLVVIAPDEIQVEQAGNQLSLAPLNFGSLQNKFLNLDNVLRLLSRPVARGGQASTLVSVAQFIYDHYGNYNEFNGTPLQADKIDLASYIPTTGNHRLVQLWLDTFNNSVQVIAGTPKDLTIAYTSTDYDEVWASTTRFQDWLPLQAYDLSVDPSGINTITQKALGRDHRQFINVPPEIGNEYSLTINTRIRANRQFVVHNVLTVGPGYTIVAEPGSVVMVTSESSYLSNPVDVFIFNVNYVETGSEDAGSLYANSDEYTLNYVTGLGPVLQINQETVIPFYNNTGSTITNGQVLRPVAGALVGGKLFPTFELAQSDIFENCEGTIVVATMDIPNNTVGVATRFGRVRGINTSGFTAGDDLYISATTPGALTNVKPSFPNYEIKIGGAVDSAVDGQIFVSITTDIFDLFRNERNGTFAESFDFRISSNGTTITGSIEPTNGHDDLTGFFSDVGFWRLDTSPAATITLTAGTDANPQTNYVYIPVSTKVLTVSTSDWPSTEHIKIAQCVLQTASAVQHHGALRNQNINDEIANTTSNQGHVSHLGERIRIMPAVYWSGLDVTVSGTPTDFYIASTAGTAYQMHRQAIPIFSMIQYNIDAVSTGSKTFTISGDGDLSSTFPDGRLIQVNDSTGNDRTYTIVSTSYSAPDFVITVSETIPSATADGTIGDSVFIVNDSVTSYLESTNLADDLSLDSGGSTLNNRWFSLVFWPSNNKTNEEGQWFCNLPSGSYTSEANAIADALNYSNYDIPSAFLGTGLLAVRLTVKLAAGGITYNGGDAFDDLRGKFPNTTAGGGGGSGSGATTFLGLTDTPSAYTSQAGKVPAVNSGETALEFIEAGKLIFIEEKTFSSAATTTTFSSLTGTDSYFFTMRMKNDEASTANYHMRINGDSASTDYVLQQLSADNTSVTAIRVVDNAAIGICLAGQESFASGYCGLSDGRFFASNIPIMSSGSDNAQYLLRAIKKNTGSLSSITSISFVSLITDGIGIDSVITLWRLTT